MKTKIALSVILLFVISQNMLAQKRIHGQKSTDFLGQIPPGGSVMIFASDRPGGYGGHDQYISFRNKGGTWTVPKNMGKKFNNSEDNYDIDISPDSRNIFLYLNDDIYWMQNRILVTSF